MIVFEVRGSVTNFVKAIKRVEGLELVDEEELIDDESDEAPVLYLVVPDARALKQMESLWKLWVAGDPLPPGFTPWRDVFQTLRGLRPWGPQDRVQEDDRATIAEEIADRPDDDRVKLEVELVFRADERRAAEIEAELGDEVDGVAGRIVSRSRIESIGYHAVLVDYPVAAARQVLARRPTSIAGLDLVMHIRPQSVATSIEVADAGPSAAPTGPPPARSPILALLDGVPIARHRLLSQFVDVDDAFDLEPSAQVSDRRHGTAMASLIVHGDRNRPEPPLPRRILCVPVLGGNDGFPQDQLIIDLIYRAIERSRRNADGSAREILIVNLSLGNPRRPFFGRVSPWARLIDHLSYQMGILFVVSAGNHTGTFAVPGFTNSTAFEDAPERQRAEGVIRGVDNLKADRRLVSPSESINAVTVGGANIDAVLPADRRTARVAVNPHPSLVMSNASSALGPGFAGSVKPDILMPGSQEHLLPIQSGGGLTVRPNGPARAHGLRVAAPPGRGSENAEGYTDGTSAAAALASRTCHQIHDALELTYGDVFTQLPTAQRAALLKALLIHTAAWPEATFNLLKAILGPPDNTRHFQQKDNIRRFLGYGFGDPDAAVACAGDRATFWASGTLLPDQGAWIEAPLPTSANARALPHALVATVAWLTPTLIRRQTYRAVRLSLFDPEEVEDLGIAASGMQPDYNQARRGTVFSRRWEGARPPIITANQTVRFLVQRDKDRGDPIDEAIPFGLALTFTMPGVNQIYDEVRACITPRPRVVPPPRVRPR